MKLRSLFLGLYILFISCEGESGGDGFVFDKNTGIALDSVMCINALKQKK